MTVRQTILKFFYPLIMKRSGSKNSELGIQTNRNQVRSLVPFYSLKATLINQKPFEFTSLKGKKLLLVNLASNCGFTPQFRELEKLFQLYNSNLVILGFPANDFKGQEPGTNEEIEKFCKRNYGVSFPVFSKASVLKPEQQEVFEWLTTKEMNGWNDQLPSWNFCKYLIDESGELQAIFKPHISPLNVEVLKMIEAPATTHTNYQSTLNEPMQQALIR